MMHDEVASEVRIGAASLAAFPSRLYKTEAAVEGRPITRETIRDAREALMAEAAPIDDIRSTAVYRKCVAANLVEEFLLECGREKR
jgi:xanthine dehydrogenase small subunit